MNQHKRNAHSLWLLVVFILAFVSGSKASPQPVLAEGNEPFLIKDVNDYSEGSDVGEMFPYNNQLYFFANDTIHGKELWRTDGSTTNLFKDINPGTGDSRAGNGWDPCGFGILNGKLYFGADDGVNGAELWISDGLPENTFLLKDTNPTGSACPISFTNANALLFFLTGSSDDQRLWRTDGTPDGTLQVIDMPVKEIAAYNNALYFSANDGSRGWELWKTNGSADQAELVADINPTGDSLPREFFAFGSALYFSADDGAAPGTGHGRELWKTDRDGTSLVEDINPGASASGPNNFIFFKDTMYFVATTSAAGCELWSSKGTAGTTSLVADIYPGGESGITLVSAAVTDNDLFFTANDSIHGAELWKTDGITTRLAADIIPGAGGSLPLGITAVGKYVYFAADGKSEIHVDKQDRELYRSDGITTIKVKDIYPGEMGGLAFSSYPYAVLNGKLFFEAEDGHYGYEPWVSDGTVSGTRMLRDINEKSYGSGIRSVIPYKGRLFFAGSCEPWITNGTRAGTYRIKDVDPSGPGICNNTPIERSVKPVEVNGWMYFISAIGTDYRSFLWKTDGTEANTQQVSSTPYYALNFMVENAGKLFFINSLSVPNGLITSDGTAAGTKAIYSFTDGTPVAEPVVKDGWVYFFMDGIEFKFAELWKSNGSQTIKIKTFDNPSFWSFYYLMPRSMVVANGLIFFFSHTDSGKVVLWQTDGTSEGTQPVEDGEVSYDYVSDVNDALAINNAVYFTGVIPASPYPYTCNLYRTQGRDSGVELVESSITCPITQANGKIYFSKQDGSGGAPLWQTDGTQDGTKPFLSTSGSYRVTWPLVWNSEKLVFMAYDAQHGVEMWISPDVPADGPSDQTRMIADLAPGTASMTSPYNLTSLGGQVLFTFDDGIHGDELWGYEVAPWNNLYLPAINR